MTVIYKVKHEPSGLYLGAVKWGERLHTKGKEYITFNKAVSALKSSLDAGDKHGLSLHDFIVETYTQELTGSKRL